uniref:Uncharacterized protein n=1 Tax=Octopus bimaculoides TaxID=37653 RepID=A0A0L8I8W0_OCTBM
MPRKHSCIHPVWSFLEPPNLLQNARLHNLMINHGNATFLFPKLQHKHYDSSLRLETV